jgi:hypothetical protein
MEGLVFVSEMTSICEPARWKMAQQQEHCSSRYFVGDSILKEPATGFIRAHQHGKRLLVVALNDQDQPQELSFKCDLSLWLPGQSHQVKEYNMYGSLLRTRETGDAIFSCHLALLDLMLFEIQ